MVESEYTADLKSAAARIEGSSPSTRTIEKHISVRFGECLDLNESGSSIRLWLVCFAMVS